MICTLTSIGQKETPAANIHGGCIVSLSPALLELIILKNWSSTPSCKRLGKLYDLGDKPFFAGWILYSTSWYVYSTTWNVRFTTWNIHTTTWNIFYAPLFQLVNCFLAVWDHAAFCAYLPSVLLLPHPHFKLLVSAKRV